ncbi:MAG TPA: CBS domain-containing protein [Thermoleophilaceae bacterium]|jgi:CBS domain-containing protein
MTRGTVGELMHPGVIACEPDASLGEVALLLVRHRIHAVFVAGDDGEPTGVLTDIDLLAGEWLAGDEEGLAVMRGITAGELMSAPPQTIDVAATAGEAAARLRAGGIGRLLVVDQDRAVGVISVSDLVAGLARRRTVPRNVGGAMSQAIVVCRPEATLEAAARAMTERRSRSVVVVDEGGTVAGIITGHDLLALHEQPEGGELVRDLMTRELRTITRDASLREAADLMLLHEVHRLVVIDAERPLAPPVGLVSTADIAAAMAEPESVWRGGAAGRE